MKSWGKKAGLVFLAMHLVGIGVALFLETGLGSDSIGLLCDGIRHATGLQFGHASLLYNLVVILLALLAARTNMGLGTVIYALFSGYFIDFYSYLLAPLHLAEAAFGVRFALFAVGQCCLSLALALLIQMRLGMNALDAVLYRVNQAIRVPYAAMRTAIDLSYVVIGTLLGGTFGVGTVCSVLLTGTMVSFFTRQLSVVSVQTA